MHIAALGGLWQAVMLGFLGLVLSGDALSLSPTLPANWRSMQFRVRWRGRRIKLGISDGGQTVAATLEAGEPMTLVVHGTERMLK